MSDVIVKMENISKSFAGIRALNKVKIELRRGEVHALVGENGAGKSTLMKILTGVYNKDEGEIYIRNEQTGEMELTEVKDPLRGQRLGMSMVFQELNLLENMNIAENILIGREPVGKATFVNKKKLNEMACEELARVQLDVNPQMMVSRLSCAQKQCIEIAKALSYKARVVVFDEPTASLSEQESKTLFNIIRKLKSEGVCIVYISHRMEEIFELADKITVFRNGEYIDTVNNENVTEMDLIKMMIGKDLGVAVKCGSNHVNHENIVMSVKNVKVFPNSKPINFDLYDKEIVGFFGLVGAGRTELSRLIFGIDKLVSGELYVKGNRVKIRCPRDAINTGIGLVPEDRKRLGLVLGMSVKDNMLISKLGQMKSYFLNKKKLKGITGTYIKDLGIILRDETQAVKELSGGNQQKVVIAKWLSMTPDILIMDEPTRGIDVGAKQEIYLLMRKLAESGKSIVMITSEIDEIMKISDRILVMHEGDLVAELTIEEAVKNNVIQAAFGGISNEYKYES
ncbi:MAG TPA: sugar ABC transporter ATP-binding protein [Anaerovoracaceae bacterium]|nr:sugar ABC transporter ATP-binding protein [Anaerovoracaceae bacterium]